VEKNWIDIFQNMMKYKLTPMMKENGFKKDGVYYTRKYEQFTLIINVIRSMSDSKKLVQFTINIGFDIYDYKEIVGDIRMPHKYGTYYIYNKRIGSILYNGCDKWYYLGEDISLNIHNVKEEAVFDDLRKDIELIFEKIKQLGTIEKIILQCFSRYHFVDVYTYLVMKQKKREVINNTDDYMKMLDDRIEKEHGNKKIMEWYTEFKKTVEAIKLEKDERKT